MLTIRIQVDRVMDEAIQMLTDKVIRFGREQRQLWIALAAHGYWKARKDPSQRAVYMQEAVDKITRPYYKVSGPHFIHEVLESQPNSSLDHGMPGRRANRRRGPFRQGCSASGHAKWNA